MTKARRHKKPIGEKLADCENSQDVAILENTLRNLKNHLIKHIPEVVGEVEFDEECSPPRLTFTINGQELVIAHQGDTYAL